MEIRGPLGLWPFPLLNFLLALLSQASARSQAVTADSPGPRKRIYQLVRDEKGRIVEIVEIEA